MKSVLDPPIYYTLYSIAIDRRRRGETAADANLPTARDALAHAVARSTAARSAQLIWLIVLRGYLVPAGRLVTVRVAQLARATSMCSSSAAM